jgi:GT2 family glycosyltransferase/glycosyltransferase involved in cell wall biosynthesis
VTGAAEASGLKGKGSRLEALFSDISRAIGEGRLETAIRLADCACRHAPEDTTCLLVHGRLIACTGVISQATSRLRGGQDRDGLLAYAELLCAQGSSDGASAVKALLSRFAVNSFENLAELATGLCRQPSASFRGWVGIDTELQIVGQVQSGSHLAIHLDDTPLHPAIDPLARDGIKSFKCRVPIGRCGRITARDGESELLGSKLAWPPDFSLSGWVAAEDKTLVGKVCLDWAPALPVTLAIAQSGIQHVRHARLPSAAQPGESLFCVPLEAMECHASRLEVSAVLPDGTCSPLAGSPVVIAAVSPTPVGGWRKRTIHTLSDVGSKRMIDIVVPVFAGRYETLACLNSVLATTTRSETELVVINDASPDPELTAALADLAEDGHITLLTNHSNLGFPATANRGMSLHPDRDVVLLNADTELFGDWLDRLKFSAYCEDDIGTVTPLGEAASIASYSGELRDTHSDADAAEIDRIAREVNARKVVELPVAVGYCLYLKRACIRDAGTFDEIRFGKGYGEENDFCLRARRMGWRHVAATDLFVRHRGARSYGRMKQMLMERNSRVLNALHPGYDKMIADFVAADPLLEARRSIDIGRLLKAATDPVLLVTFDLPGGVKRHVDERRSKLAAEGRTVLTLRPSETNGRPNQVLLDAPFRGLDNLAFNLPDDFPVLRDLLLKLKLSKIELHHFAGFLPAALELVTSIGIEYDVYVHDYSWICPRMTLVGGDGVYCGEPAIEDCENCILMHGTALEKWLTVEALRIRSSRILKGANAVIVPADDVRTRLARYFPNLPVEVEAWEEAVEPVIRGPVVVSRPVRIAVIGAISVPKGYQILLNCAHDAAERGIDLEFVVIGFTCDDEALLATGRVFITGPYAENEVSTLLEREQCHSAFFPSIAPETWCYALSHALARGLPIVAFDLGAIAERLRSYAAADLLPLSAPIAAINDTLLRAGRGISTLKPEKELEMDPTPSTDTASVSEELSASVQLLTLPAGTYTFTVQGGGGTGNLRDKLVVPALQVGLAPMQSAGEVAFVTREGTSDRWLARRTDMIIAKVYGESASLMLTSVRLPGSPALAIDVRRLGDESVFEKSEIAAGETSGELPANVIAHIQNLGDIPFADGLVGCIGGSLWIEAFAIVSCGPVGPDLIEYRGITGDGFQTPWLGNQMLCGSRGRRIPMLAYAIRLKPEVADQYDCTYTGKFLSGSTLGPFKNGELCRSEVPDDPLWGFELRMTPHMPKSVNPSPDLEQSKVA